MEGMALIDSHPAYTVKANTATPATSRAGGYQVAHQQVPTAPGDPEHDGQTEGKDEAVERSGEDQQGRRRLAED